MGNGQANTAGNPVSAARDWQRPVRLAGLGSKTLRSCCWVALSVFLWGAGAAEVILAYRLAPAVSQTHQTEDPRVEIEVVFDPRAPLRNGAEWAKMLSEAGFDRVVMRKATPNDELGWEKREFAGRSHWTLRAGIVRNRLILPGWEAGQNQRAQIRDWLTEWKRKARSLPEGANPSVDQFADQGDRPFGLNDRELVDLAEQLAAPVTTSTAGKTGPETWQILQAASPILLVPTPDSAKAMVSPPDVDMELKGLSTGTAMAAFARPLGLVLVPGKSTTGQFQLTLQSAGKPPEYWPIGWPTGQALIDRATSAMRRVDVDLRGQTVAEAFRLLSQRANVPILLDRNSLLAAGRDVDQQLTNVVARDKTIRSVMTLLATERRPAMRIEIREDEAGTAFFWISARP